jgi:GT2 family glycosyltransferase
VDPETLMSAAKGPRCGVVIPTFNGAHVLRPCLEALLAHPPERCAWTIIVVDDASTDATPQLLQSYGARIQAVRHTSNAGFATACNRGAEAAGDVDHLVFLNNDTLPLAGWLDALVDEASAHPDAGAVGARLLFPNGTVQHAGVAIGQDGWPHHLYAGFPGEHPAVMRSKAVVAATAACLLVRREAFDALGGFDPVYRNGYEDIDFCLRLRDIDLGVRYAPHSVLYHLESVTRWPTGKPETTETNDRLFSERWAERLRPDDMEHYLADGLLSVRYRPYYPVEISISPDLAELDRGTGADPIERMLGRRSEQVMELLGRQTRAALDESRRHFKLSLRTGPATPSASPRLLRTGATHALGDGDPRHVVSVLMPLKNQAAAVRELLPLVLSQQAPALVELIAVDSGSSDDTVDVLAEFDATVIAIDPRDFDHGLTRNLAARHAKGDVLVFLNGRSRPVGRDWLAPLLAALDEDPSIAGACSRVIPLPDADPLTAREVSVDLSGSQRRETKRILDWGAYRCAPVEQRRALLNFHSVSAAIRAETFSRIPFRSVATIGEDLLWAREVLEAGFALVHEPASVVCHSHSYPLHELFARNVDDGIANRDIVGRKLGEQEVLPLVRALVEDDWRHLRESLDVVDGELETWQLESALRRLAQVVGQWLGSNYDAMPDEVTTTFSRVGRGRAAAARLGP